MSTQFIHVSTIHNLPFLYSNLPHILVYNNYFMYILNHLQKEYREEIML